MMNLTDYLSVTARVMGVLNVTPDSFSDGGLYCDVERALDHAKNMVTDGASILDVGGESSRPGSTAVDSEEQLRRVLPVIEALNGAGWDGEECPIISIDTTSSRVADRAIGAGAAWVNDITAGSGDPDMFAVVAQRQVPIVLMHMQGTPATMQDSPHYLDVVDEVIAFLEDRIQRAVQSGIQERNILLDPGIGFGKSRDHNLAILGSLNRLVRLGFPVVLGCSRKRFMGRICNEEDPKALLGSTVSTTALGLLDGVKVFRVHDVKPNRQAIEVMQAVKRFRVGM